MHVTNCRLCLTGELSEPKISFPPTALANEFVDDPAVIQDLFPLEVCVCKNCGHYQLNESVDSSRLFKNYVFVSGTSPINVEHFRQYAEDMINTYKFKANDKVLDIASNDGTLLKHFKDLGLTILGIDPAENIVKIANENGITTISEFFTDGYADIMLAKYGQFDLITAANVFAHVTDLVDFTKGVKKLLAPNGVFSFEVSYFMDVCNKTLFDTIYHEHVDYHTITPLINFFKKYDLEIFDVKKINTHGGSIRVFVKLLNDTTFNRYETRVSFNISSTRLSMTAASEVIIKNKVNKLQKKINDLGTKLKERLSAIKADGKSISIYGMPAKATTLLYGFNIDPTIIDCVFEDAPLKIGKFTPGKHIPVVASSELYDRKPDYTLILSWNFAESIMVNHKKYLDNGGHFIVPLPELLEY